MVTTRQLATRSVPQASLASDPADAEAQFAETIDLAWRSLRRLGVPDAVLADAVQDTLLVVHRRRAEFRGEASFRAKSPAPDPSTSAELDLIVTARNGLATKRHADARAAAERHALQFPSGAFSEEREAILALCACRETGASERARAFIEGRPDSLFAERIRRDCKLASNLVPGTSAPGTHQESPPRSGAH